MPDINLLLSAIQSSRTAFQEEASLLKTAFEFSRKIHGNSKRKSGEPYFNHCYGVALNLAQWGMDVSVVVAGLLHDAEDANVAPDVIKNNFGEDAAFLVNGVAKLGKLKYRENTKLKQAEKIKIQAENLRKMILVISEDLRVVFIKLADRLHNMQTLNFLPPAKQRRIALETAEIYVPLAYRLGMANLAGELEDLSFPYLHPQEYQWLLENVKDRYEDRLKHLEKTRVIAEEELRKNKIHPLKIDYRAKRFSSLYKKLQRYDMDLEQIHDLVAVRIILNSIEECYVAMGIIHQLWTPLPGKIKDYIAFPKPNGYRSLHTTVIGEDKTITEFQVRTEEMHKEAEEGVAAYWAYSQAKSSKNYLKKKAIFADHKELGWVQQLKKWQENLKSPEDFLEFFKVDFFQDRVFAITPRGEVIDLPAGATPVDFAYAVHTKIGDECAGARINNKLAPLDYQIQSGDVVEILTQKNKKPSESWLELVKTAVAKKHVKASLKRATGILRPAVPKIKFKIAVEDRVGILRDISAVVARAKINITNIGSVKRPGLEFIQVTCEGLDKERAGKLAVKIKDVAGVKGVEWKNG